MAAIPATQLSAQLISSVEASSAATAASSSAGEGALAFLFADILAQQLNVGMDGLPVADKQPIDLKDTLLDEPSAELPIEVSAGDSLSQLQQVLIPPAMPSVTPVPPAEVPSVETDIPPAVDVLIGSAKPALPNVIQVEPPVSERQVFAAELEVVAEVEAAPVPLQDVTDVMTAGQSMRVATPSQPAVVNTAPVAGAIAQPVTSPTWGDVLGDRVMWMVGQQQQSAELRLNPPALGPLEVKLSMTDGQATVTFSTQHLPVKEALDAATPRLREMFGESGLNLGSVSVNVGTSPQQQQQAEAQPGHRNAEWNGTLVEGAQEGGTVVGVMAVRTQGTGMVDYFA